MADEEAKAAEETEASEDEGKKSGGGMVKWIIIGVVVVMLSAGAGVGVGVVLLGDSQTAEDAEGEDGEDGHADEELAEEEEVKKAKPEDEHEEDSSAALGTMYSLESFIVNINDTGRDRYLKLKIELELRDPAVATEIDQRLPQMRDLVIGLLGSKSFEEVRSMEGKNFLRQEMLHRVNSLLTTGKARRVFFTEFVVQ